MTPFADLVAVGCVVKPQGRKGEVAVRPLSDRPGRFATLERAFLEGVDGQAREVRIERVWPHKGRFVVKIAGVDSIETAETLRGLELRIPEGELAPLPEGSFYHHQLAGLQVEDAAGVRLGVVEQILETGADACVLVVRDAARVETLVPFAAVFVRSVDLAGKRLIVNRPEYAVAD